MKQVVTLLLLVFIVSSCCCKSTLEISTNTIFPKGEKVSNNNFTGNVWLQMLGQDEQSLSTGVGNVTFEPGARTKWHLHPGGQIILVTDGVGYYQEKGQPKKILHKGDVIKCPANVEHWHGASKDSYFVQIAVTDNKNGSVIWLQPVIEEEYYK